jgi:hypothetical protein
MADEEVNDAQEQETKRRIAERLQQENVYSIAQVTRNAIIATGNRLHRESLNGGHPNLPEITMMLAMQATVMSQTIKVHLLAFGPKPPPRLGARSTPTRTELVFVDPPVRGQAQVEGGVPASAGSPECMPDPAGQAGAPGDVVVVSPAEPIRHVVAELTDDVPRTKTLLQVEMDFIMGRVPIPR